MLDISKRYIDNGRMAVPRQKLVELHPDVLDAVHDDAQRCRRSDNKQIEAILVVYYGLGDVNIKDMAGVRSEVSQLPGEIPVEVGVTDTKLGGKMTDVRGRQRSKTPQVRKSRAKKR